MRSIYRNKLDVFEYTALKGTLLYACTSEAVAHYSYSTKTTFCIGVDNAALATSAPAVTPDSTAPFKVAVAMWSPQTKNPFGNSLP